MRRETSEPGTASQERDGFAEPNPGIPAAGVPFSGTEAQCTTAPIPMADLEDGKLRRRIRDLARRLGLWGHRLDYRRLGLNGWSVNHKRLKKIWWEEGLQRSLPARANESAHVP